MEGVGGGGGGGEARQWVWRRAGRQVCVAARSRESHVTPRHFLLVLGRDSRAARPSADPQARTHSAHLTGTCPPRRDHAQHHKR